ncbi:MAG: rod-binding protein [Rhodospirillales bacterium]|nr:rod-binding protein [Rhodospirillales bacterium]MDH3910639.1 rod-binding protein [Rhodospirillales bacterium]MDH3919010.1 rod-binding protein [Rhodospirillales bacterium]MDH3965560.1 rod-binding protein [Rhodospirillales bacterium]
MDFGNLGFDLLTRVATASGQADPAAGLAGPGAETRKAAEEFEALFLTEMLNPIFDNLESGAFGGGPGERIYRSLLVREYAAGIARSGGLGLADAVQREILKLQEKTP